MPAQAQWYFDFVSPYAYLQFKRLNEVPSSLDYEMVPILFAGLLKHWEHKGPAEIGPKRIDTYRHCQWLAEDLGIPFRLPQAHPFNPLPYLRLCISLGSSPEVITLDRAIPIRELVEKCAQAAVEVAEATPDPTARQITRRLAERALECRAYMFR